MVPGLASSARETSTSTLSFQGERETDRVHRALKRIAKARAALDAQEIAALRAAQRLQLWKEFGYASLVEYMERQLGYSARAAVERIRIAISIEELPQLEAALDEGSLPFSGARGLTRVVVPENQEAWLDATKGKTAREIEAMVSGRKRGDLPSDPVDDSLRTQVVRFEVTAATAAIVREYQKLRARQLGNMIDDDVLVREVFQQALDALEPRQGGSKRVTRPRYQIAVVICESCKRGSQNAAGETTPMTPAEVECAKCDAEDIGRVDIPGVVARKRSTIPPALKQKVLARDNYRCLVPGCRSTNIDVHHLEAQSQGGKHTEGNMGSICEGHHLATHRGTLKIEGVAPHLTFTFVGEVKRRMASHAEDTRQALQQLGFKSFDAARAVEAAYPRGELGCDVGRVVAARVESGRRRRIVACHSRHTINGNWQLTRSRRGARPHSLATPLSPLRRRENRDSVTETPRGYRRAS